MTSQELETCAICGSQVELIQLKDWDRPTTPAVTIHNVDCYACTDCGERFLTPKHWKAVERKTNQALRESKKLMSGEEIDQLTKKIAQLSGLSDTAVASGFGVQRQELYRWRSNERIQSPLADSFLRYAASNPEGFAAYVLSSVGEPAKRGRPKKKAL